MRDLQAVRVTVPHQHDTPVVTALTAAWASASAHHPYRFKRAPMQRAIDCASSVRRTHSSQRSVAHLSRHWTTPTSCVLHRPPCRSSLEVVHNVERRIIHHILDTNTRRVGTHECRTVTDVVATLVDYASILTDVSTVD